MRSVPEKISISKLTEECGEEGKERQGGCLLQLAFTHLSHSALIAQQADRYAGPVCAPCCLEAPFRQHPRNSQKIVSDPSGISKTLGGIQEAIVKPWCCLSFPLLLVTRCGVFQTVATEEMQRLPLCSGNPATLRCSHSFGKHGVDSSLLFVAVIKHGTQKGGKGLFVLHCQTKTHH